jgi:hypothetical protein
MGDGWGENAYLNRQLHFRDYQRLLVYENGVYFIDTYRYLASKIRDIYAVLKKLNPMISGEDRGFAGDCCYTTQRHFIDCMLDDKDFETNRFEYLKTLVV